MALHWTPATPLLRQEIVHQLRSYMEASRRAMIYHRSANMPWIYQPNVTHLIH
ncbi:hypothetical protein J3E69DRAFT_329949 [Trichoderma sp. SZMC 28015]